LDSFTIRGGTLTINGNFTIGTSVTYSTTQTGVMSFAGNFTNNGTLTNGAGTQIILLPDLENNKWIRNNFI
jgi:hypothetical protein